MITHLLQYLFVHHFKSS